MPEGIHSYIRYAEAYRDAKEQMLKTLRVNRTLTFPVLEHKISVTTVDTEEGDIYPEYFLVACVTCAKVLHLRSPVPLVCIGYHLAKMSTSSNPE